MSAGRGSVRINPVSGLPSPWVIPAEQDAYRFYQVPPGPWGVVQRVTTTEPQALTATYEPYGPNNGTQFRIPYGAIRMSLVVNYLPASIGGQLGLQIRWDPPPGYDLSSYLAVLNVYDEVTFGVPTSDYRAAEVDQYVQSIVTPPGANLAEQNYVLPFWVPPMIPELDTATPDLQPTIPLRLSVREASGVAPEGSVALLAVVSESFGQPFLVRGTTP